MMPDPAIPHGAKVDWSNYATALNRGRWIILGVLAIALTIGAAIIEFAPRAYTSETTLEIEREPQKVAAVGSAIPADTLFGADETAQTQYGLLHSRGLAVRVGRMLGLDHQAAFVRESPAGGGKEAGIRFLREHLQIAPLRGSRLVTLRFTDSDPMMSARIAGAFATAFIDLALERRLQAADYARGFLQSQLVEARTRLELSEQGLAGYAASQGIIPLPGAAPGVDGANGRSLTADNLEAFNTALAAARTDRIAAEQRWRAGIAAGAAAPEVLASPTVQQISQDRAKLAADYRDRLSIFKPEYPDMRQLKARMDETDRQLTGETATILVSLHARFAAALGAEQVLAAQVAELKTSLIDLRQRSIRYTILQREVETNRILYDGLLQRFRDVGVAGGVIADNITIIDPATPPDKPSSPRPLLVLLLSAMAGLAVGVGTALARERRRY